jgi:hypothetical protein
MKFLLSLIFAMFLVSCGEAPEVQRSIQKPDEEVTNFSGMDGLELTCSSSGNGNSLKCTTGQTIPLPATFPNSKDCNKCLTTFANGIASVECPNGLNFQFTPVKGDKGDKGDTGAKGAKGDSCTVGTDGWVRCEDGTSYKLLAGPKGDTGAKGDKGDTGIAGANGGSCHTAYNEYGLPVINCDDGSSTVLSSCGGGGCWSFGAKGNVYTLPSSTTTLPDYTPMTPEESSTVDTFSVFNRQSSLGYPGLPARQTYFGIRYTGFILVPVCPAKKCFYRLTSDDGAAFIMDNYLVVNGDGLHSPTAFTGSIVAENGWHTFRIDYFQGPATQIALALEVSVDNGSTYTVVPQNNLKFLVSP